MNLQHMASVIPLLFVSSMAGADSVNGTFQVLVTVMNSCTLTAGSGSNINFGSLAANSGSHTNSNAILVNCSKTTPYFIGLAPSNGNTLGAGVLKSVANSATNTDEVPYQLNQTPTGPIWGNTATSTSVGNGVAGIGTGIDQAYNVYATVSSVNFTPDTYADTVTVNVNF